MLRQPTFERRRGLGICLTVDFDVIGGYLGIGDSPENAMADDSAGMLSANAAVGGLLKVLRKYGVAERVTCFIPGHTIGTSPEQVGAIAQTGAEIDLHGYSHEDAQAMTVEQEHDVIKKWYHPYPQGVGRQEPPKGYRGPLYQIRESTISILHKPVILYDSSVDAHGSPSYFLKCPLP